MLSKQHGCRVAFAIAALIATVLWSGVNLPSSMADIPRIITVSGVIAAPGGAPKPDGAYTVALRLYDVATSGVPIWSEEGKSVTVSGGKGLFVTALGSKTPLAGIAFDRPYWLEVQVQGDSPMVPRVSLASVPYAFTSGAANLSLPFTGSANVADPGSALRVTNTGNGLGIVGVSSANVGVRGISDTWVGVWGYSQTSSGVHGESTSWAGVSGKSTTHAGMWGESRDSYGVLGLSDKWEGVHGASNSDKGVYGTSKTWVGVWGHSESSTAVFGEGNTGVGVHGKSNNSTGVRGESGPGWGVHGLSSGNSGVHGQSASGIGVEGRSDLFIGVSGVSGSGTGVKGHSDNVSGFGVHGSTVYGNYGALGATFSLGPISTVRAGVLAVGGPLGQYGSYGLVAQGPTGAGYFNGGVYVGGTLTASNKQFRIDHPLDPTNKTLTHNCTEGPEPLNVYNGNVTTDSEGLAVVRLPDYFEALNRDFRYQLTCLGQFAQAIVADEVKDNRFTIRTDRPNVKVSWMVIGVRNDAFMRTHTDPVEAVKPAHERGRYLNPEAFGQPEEMGSSRIVAEAINTSSR